MNEQSLVRARHVGALRRRLGVGAVALTAVVGSLAVTSSATASTPEINAATTVGQPPTARLKEYWLSPYFSERSFSVVVGTTWRFDGTFSRDPEGGPLKYFWSSDDDRSTSDQPFFDKPFNTVGKVKLSLTVTDEDGNSASTFGYVNVTAQPDGATLGLVPPNDRVVSPGTTLTWEQQYQFDFGWDFSLWWASDEPMGLTDAKYPGFTVTKAFEKPGVVRVQLQNYGADSGQSAAATVKVTVAKPDGQHLPEANLSPTADQWAWLGESVTFDASKSLDLDGGPLTYRWTDDGAPVSSTGTSFTKQFDTLGWHTVSVQVTDPQGNAATETRKVLVRPVQHAPVAKFTPSGDPTVTSGSTVTFDGTLSTDEDNQALTYEWTTDDSTKKSTEPTLTKKFRALGPVKVTLKVTDPDGLVSETATTVNVVKNEPPVADFAGPTTVTEGVVASFDGSASSDPNNEPLTYEWYTSGVKDPIGTSATLDYTFPKAGSYGLELRVKDPLGASGNKWVRVTVVTANQAPTAEFSVPSSITPGAAVTFDGSASSDPNGDALIYEWRVSGADGVVGSSKALNYTFPAAGTYRVGLTVKDPSGLSSQKQVDVTVTAPNVAPTADFGVPTGIKIDQKVSFDGSLSTDPNGDALTYAWRVRGAKGVVSTAKVLEYTFPRAGKFGVQLTVKDPSGASSTKWVEVTVTGATNKPPVAGFTVPSTITAGTPVDIDGSLSSDPDGDVLTYSWRVRYAKGVVSTSKVLNYTFPRAGKYGVQLTVKDPSGASSTKWVEVTVTSTNRAPVANFSAPSAITAGQAATFDGSLSTDPDGDALKYAWYVRGEKGVVSTDPVLNYPFPKAGRYGVELRVTDPSGATAKKWIGVTVK